MTALSRRGYIGIGLENVAQGTYRAPTFFIPASNIAAEDVYVPIRDESYRNNDTVLQGLYQGPGDSTFGFDVMSYADALPYLLRSMIGPDTVTPGVSTTLTGNTAANAASIPLTASVPSNSVIQISDATGANLEYVKIGTVTGSGPYTAPITTGGGTGGNTTKFAHTAAGGSVISQSTHNFAQNPTAAQVSYSLTKYDVVTNSGGTSATRGFPGCKVSELALKIDPKAALVASVKWTGWLSAPQTDPTPSFSQLQPMLGWQWAMTNGGASSTRGLTYDLTLKRATDAIHASTGTQNPRETFQGGFEVDGSYKAIYENDNDLSLYLAYSQLPASAVLTQPVLSGGNVLTITSSKAGFQKGVVDTTGPYLAATFGLSGIWNSTDIGAITASITNYSSVAY